MAKVYNPIEHTNVMIRCDGTLGGRGGPRRIIHNTASREGVARVWIYAHVTDDLPPDAIQVGDDFTDGVDENGCTIVSVPAAWCTFHTDEEAESIERCMEADEVLLSYAR